MPDNEAVTIVVDMNSFPRPKIGLALSGGGARGMAHIGALSIFEQEKIPIDYCVGTSIGAIIGGLYSAGYTTHELDSLARVIDWESVFSLGSERQRSDLFLDQKYEQDRSLLSLRFNRLSFVVPEAISGGSRFISLLQELFWKAVYHDNGNFNDLKIPFRAVVTDISHGTSVSLRQGSLALAVKASATVPLRNTPVYIDSMVLVDGGLMENIPIKALTEFSPDISIAINTSSPLLPPNQLHKPWNIADQVVSVMMSAFNKEARLKSTYIIEPKLPTFSNSDFSSIEMVIDKGKIETQMYIERIRQSYRHKQDSLLFQQYVLPIITAQRGDTVITVEFEGSMNVGKELMSVSKQKITPTKFVEILRTLHQTGLYASITLQFEQYANETSTQSKTNIVHISGKEYPRCRTIILESNTGLTTATPMSALAHHINQKFQNFPLSPSTLRSISETILRALRAEDKSFASIISSTTDSATGALLIRIDEGNIQHVNIRGNTSATDLYVLREAEFSVGDCISSASLLQTWDNIHNTDIFSDVTIDAKIPKSTTNGNDTTGVIVGINVRERASQLLRVGGRIDNERNTQLSAEFLESNLFGSGARFGVRGGGGNRSSLASMSIDIPRILNSYWTTTIRAFWSARNVYRYALVANLPRDSYERTRDDQYDEQRYGIKALFGRQISTKGRIGIESRYENRRILPISDTVGTIPFTPLYATTFSMIFDTENRADFPQNGQFFSFLLEQSYADAPASPIYTKGEVRVRSSWSAGAHTISPSLTLGAASAGLQLPEFFNFGGQDIFFGMREEELRGRQIALAQVEYRYKLPLNLFFDTYVSLRYDLGNSWELVQNIKFGGLRHGLGATVAWDTPLGPVKTSLGRSFYFITDPNGAVLGPILAYFSVGLRL